MSVDLTSTFQDVLVDVAKRTEGAEPRDVRSSQILRSGTHKNEFGKAVDGVSRLIAVLRQALSETTGDLTADLESQITDYVHRCKSGIDALQNLCLRTSDTRMTISPMEKAHRQGCVLILSERLKGCVGSFDALQRTRAARLEQAEIAKRRRTPAINTRISKKEFREPTAPTGQDGSMSPGADQQQQSFHSRITPSSKT